MRDWHQKFSKQGLKIFAISKDTPPPLKEMAKSWGNYTLARWEQPVPEPFNRLSYPAALLIDRKGVLRAGIVGPFLMQLEKELLAALKEKPPAEKGQSVPPKKSDSKDASQRSGQKKG